MLFRAGEVAAAMSVMERAGKDSRNALLWAQAEEKLCRLVLVSIT